MIFSKFFSKTYFRPPLADADSIGLRKGIVPGQAILRDLRLRRKHPDDDGASNKEWTDYIGSKPAAEDRKISLQVPDALLESLTISTTNEDITLPALAVTGQISLSTNGGSIAFETLDVGSALTLSAKNGDISGAVAGSYDDFSIQTELKKGESNLPGDKDDGEKALRVSCNNGDVDIAFANGN